MTDNDRREQVKTLVHQLYNSTTNARLQKPLMKAYTRLEAGGDVADFAAQAASAVNYLRKTDALTLTPFQVAWLQALQGLGNPAILYHDPKNNLLDLSEKSVAGLAQQSVKGE